MGQIAGSGARFAVTVGDNGYPSGSQTNNGDLKQHAADTSAIFGPGFWTLVGKSVPLFAVPGNHGFSSGTATRSTEQINWPEDKAVSTSGGRYRARDLLLRQRLQLGVVPQRLVRVRRRQRPLLRAERRLGRPATLAPGRCTATTTRPTGIPSAPEYQWLQADLAAHPSGLKFAFFHYPMYSDQKAQNSDTYLQGTNSLEGLLSSYHVAIGFSGHAHIYERNAPTEPGTFPSYITGGGGGTLQPVGELGCSAFDAYAIGWSPTHSSGSSCGSASPPPSADHVFHFLLGHGVGHDGHRRAHRRVRPHLRRGDVRPLGQRAARHLLRQHPRRDARRPRTPSSPSTPARRAPPSSASSTAPASRPARAPLTSPAWPRATIRSRSARSTSPGPTRRRPRSPSRSTSPHRRPGQRDGHRRRADRGARRVGRSQ